MNKIRLKLQEKNRIINFEEDTHTYSLNGKKFMSVTELINLYVPEFDPSGEITERCAKKNNISVQEQKEAWEKIKVDAGLKGSQIHKICELMTWGIPLKDEINMIRPFLNNINPVATEQIVYSQEYGVAGTIDLISLDDGHLILYDYKTTKKEISEEENFYTTMLEPLEVLPNTNYVKYSLQMSLYRYLFEGWGFKISGLKLVHIKEDKFEIILIPYLKDEVIKILKRGKEKK